MKTFYTIWIGIIIGSALTLLTLQIVGGVVSSEYPPNADIVGVGEGLSLNPEKTKDDTTSINLYQELLRLNGEYIERLRTVSAYKIKENPTADKLKKFGFTNAQNAKTDDQKKSEKEAAIAILRTISFYDNKYPDFLFISAEYIKGYGESHGPIIRQLHNENGMGIFDANEFQAAIPDSVIERTAEFDLSKIDKKDMVETSCVRNGYFYTTEEDLREQKAQDKIQHEARKHEPYHDLETDFKVLAPRHMGESNKDPIILFPVKHGYLVVAHWEY